jgi:hypothetical protein
VGLLLLFAAADDEIAGLARSPYELAKYVDTPDLGVGTKHVSKAVQTRISSKKGKK